MRSEQPAPKKETNSQEAFIKNQNTCPLCEAVLEIKAVSYLEDARLREEASCPKCQLVARVKDHRMH